MRRVAAVLAGLSLATSPLLSQQRGGVVEIDHATGVARFIYTANGRSDTSVVGRNPTVRVPRGVPVVIRVVGSNTALYRFESSQSAAPLPEVESVTSLIVRSAPYMPELRTVASALGGRGGGSDAAEAMAALAETDRRDLSEAASAIRTAASRVDVAVQGRAGLQQLQTTTLFALERMRFGMAPEEAAAELQTLLPAPVACGNDAPIRLPTARNLLAGVFETARAQAALGEALAGPAYSDVKSWQSTYDSALVERTRATRMLNDYESLVTAAYKLEQLAGIVGGACSTSAIDSITARASSARRLTITALPRTEKELARVATLAKVEWTVTVQPRMMISPALSIGGLAAPGARFPLWGTATTGAGSVVARTGTSDARFSAAGVLGFTYGVLDRREVNGTALWLPELIIGAGSTPTFGVGIGASRTFLRLGVGAAWMRHRQLSGMSEGNVLADPSELRVSDGYGKPRMYISLSVFEWSPLAARLQ